MQPSVSFSLLLFSSTPLSSLLGGGFGAQRQRMQAFRQLRPQRVIDQPVPRHGTEAAERVGHDFHAEVRLCSRRARGVARVPSV